MLPITYYTNYIAQTVTWNKYEIPIDNLPGRILYDNKYYKYTLADQ